MKRLAGPLLENFHQQLREQDLEISREREHCRIAGVGAVVAGGLGGDTDAAGCVWMPVTMPKSFAAGMRRSLRPTISDRLVVIVTTAPASTSAIALGPSSACANTQPERVPTPARNSVMPIWRSVRLAL